MANYRNYASREMINVIWKVVMVLVAFGRSNNTVFCIKKVIEQLSTPDVEYRL